VEKQSLYLTHFQRKLLLKNLDTNLRAEYRRRIEIMLLADAGQSQADICKALGCCPETARYWIAIAQTGKAHLWDDHSIGRPKTVNDSYLTRLKELVSHNPREYGYPFQRWTAQWLGKHLAKELGIQVSSCHINRLLKEMGLSTRPKQNTAEKETENNQNLGIKIQDLPPGSYNSSVQGVRFPTSLRSRESGSMESGSITLV
jgi:transposase